MLSLDTYFPFGELLFVVSLVIWNYSHLRLELAVGKIKKCNMINGRSGINNVK